MFESLAWLTTLHFVFFCLAESIAISTNTVLCYLILTEHDKTYKDYRPILLLNCIVDYVFSVANIFIRPQFEIFGRALVYVIDVPITYLPTNGRIWITCLYSSVVCFGASTIPIQFMFRKYLICDNRRMTAKEIFLLTSIAFAVSVLGAYLYARCFFASAGKELNVTPLFDSGLLSGSSEVIIVDMENSPMLPLTLHLFAVTAVIFISVSWFSLQTYQNLNNMHHQMSEKTRKMQSNFNIMLTSQVGAIILFACAPTSFLAFLMFAKLKTVGAGTVITTFFMFIPVSNPVCTLFLVSHFRRRFLKMISGLLSSNNANTVVHLNHH